MEEFLYKTKQHWICLVLGIVMTNLVALIIYIAYINDWKDRVRQESGIIAKNTHYVKQDVFGRLLNYGTLVLVGTGGTPHNMKCILSGNSVREIILRKHKTK